jgi:hypothetical protein
MVYHPRHVLGSIPGEAAMSEHFALSTDPCLARSEIKAVGKTVWEVSFFASPASIGGLVLHVVILACIAFHC